MTQASSEYDQQHMLEMSEFFNTPAAAKLDTPVESANVDNTHSGTGSSTATRFRGVYVNTHKNRDKFRYRVAIAQWDDAAKKNFWINLGYFNCINVAATAYNTAALGIFLGGAKINRVTPVDCETGELAAFKELRPLRVAIAGLVMPDSKNKKQKIGKEA